MGRISTRVLKRSGLEVTTIGLGSAAIGGLFSEVSECAALEMLDAAYNHGVRFFDTAPFYGHGLAEQRVGQALVGRPRDEFVLSTKVGRLLRVGAPPDLSVTPNNEPFFPGAPADVNPVFDFSADGVRRSFEESLERLGIDRVDLLLIHDPDDYGDQVLEEALPALLELRDAGTIRAVGVGMNQSEMLARFAHQGDFDCFLLAGRYTLLDQTALDELLPLCVERDIAVIIGGVFNSGVLANPTPASRFDYLRVEPDVLARARRLEAVCELHGVPLRAAAIQFPLAHPAVVSVLCGARSRNEFVDFLAMANMKIPGDLWTDLRDRGLLTNQAPVAMD